MNTKITFTYKDVQYTLEYDRNSIKQMENAGLDIGDFLSKPMLNFEIAFKGAFLKNHRNIKESLLDEIYSKLTGKEELLATLVNMMNETYSTLTDEPEGDAEGNIKWDTVG